MELDITGKRRGYEVTVENTDEATIIVNNLAWRCWQARRQIRSEDYAYYNPVTIHLSRRAFETTVRYLGIAIDERQSWINSFGLVDPTAPSDFIHTMREAHSALAEWAGPVDDILVPPSVPDVTLPEWVQ